MIKQEYKYCISVYQCAPTDGKAYKNLNSTGPRAHDNELWNIEYYGVFSQALSL